MKKLLIKVLIRLKEGEKTVGKEGEKMVGKGLTQVPQRAKGNN